MPQAPRFNQGGPQGFRQGFQSRFGQGANPRGRLGQGRFGQGRFAGQQGFAQGGFGNMQGPGGADQQPELEYNDRIRRFYAMHLSHEDQSQIFKGTEFWNWGYWTETTSSQNEASENLLELLMSFLPEKNGKILDVACGRGATTRHVLKSYDADNVMGVNISPEQIVACRERLPEVKFEEMDAADLKFEDNSFENIICVEAICHFNTRAKFLEEAMRVLKPGGHLVFSDSLLQADTPIQPDENYLETAEQYKAVGEAAGFERVEVFDTSEESWNRFAQFHFQTAIQRMQNGELSPRDVGLTRMWLRRTAPVAYVVGWMRKAA